MNTKMTKADLMEELKTARQRIAELERVSIQAEGEALFSRVFQVSPSLIVLRELDTGKYVEVNEAFLNTLGFTREEVIGKTATELNIFVDLNQRSKLFERMLQQGYLRDEFVSLRTKAGEIRYGMLAGEFVEVQKQKLALIAMNDMTSHEKARQELKETHERLLEAQQLAHIGNWEWDLQTKTLTWSEEVYRIFGVSPADFTPTVEAFESFIHPEDKEDFLRQRATMLEEKKIVSIAHRIILPLSGEVRHVQEHTRLIVDENGTVIHIIGTVQDITEQKQTEDALSISEERFRMALKNLPLVVFNQDRDLRHTWIVNPNPSFSNVEILGKTDFDLLSPEDARQLAAVKQQVLDTGIGTRQEVKTTIQGEVIYYDLLVEPLIDSNGGITGITGTALDITERKRSEMTLQASEENYRKLAETSDSGIAVLDREGRILYANPISLRVWEDPELVVKTIHDLFTKEIADGYLAVVRRVIDEQTTDTNELEFIIKGRSMWFHANMSPLKNTNGSADTLLLNAMDITERKRAETDLAEAQRMAKLGNWHFDVASNTRIGSDELYRIFDVDKTDSDRLDELFFSRVHSEDRERVEAVYQYILTNGECFSLDYRIVTRDAVEKYIHETGYALLDPAGKVTGLLGVAQDVTEQVESAARIHESEMRFHQIAETIPEMFWIFDHAKQSLVYISPAYEDIWGYAVKNLYEGSRLYIEAVHPDDRGIVSAVLERQARGEATETQYRIVQFNGSVRWIHDRSFPVFDEANSAVLRTIGVAADITERRQVGEALRDNEERLRLSLKAAKQGLYDLNLQTGEAIVNREYAEMLGYDSETFVETNQGWFERLHPDDHEISAKAFYEYTNGLIPEYRVEFRQRTHDGNWKWILSLGKIVEYDADGKPLRLLGTHTDINELKQAELELQKRAAHLTLINDVSREIAGFLDFKAVMDIFPRLLVEAFGYHHVGLFTLEKGSNELVMFSKAGEYSGLFPQGHRIRLGQGVVGSVAKSGEMKLANQVYDDPQYIPTLIPTQAELSLPIKIAGEVVGVLDVQSPQPNAFTAEDIKVLATLVDQMAVVIENARLYEAVQHELVERKRAEEERLKLIDHLGQRVRELTVLHQSTRLFQNSTISETDVMQTLANSLSSAWQYAEIAVTRITLGDQEYRSTGFTETPWMQKAAFTLPNQREGWIEVAYLEECPEADEGPFLKEERQLIETLAQMLQAALARQSMERDLRKRTDDLANLLEAGRALSETLEPDRIYPLVYRYIADAIPCDYLVLSSFDLQTELIKCEYMHSDEGSQDVSSFPPIPLEAPGRGTQSLVIRSGESLLLPDYDQAFITAANRMQFNEKAEILEENLEDPERTRSAIIVPLKINGVVVGALQVFSMELNAHTPDHLHFVEALAFHVSAALSNARLFSELEKRVQQRTAEVQDLYENAPTGYHSLNGEGRIVTINQTELEWLGYTREEIIGRPFTDIITPETAHVFVENFPIFKQKGRVNNLEFELLCKDGTSFPVLINATAVKNEAGDFLMSRSTVFDDTERKQAEFALREREQIYRALFQSANDAIFMLSPDGIILQANPSSVELLGYTTADEILGEMSGSLIADSDQDDADNVATRLLAGEHLPVYERIFVRKDGTLIETEVNLSLIRDEYGEPKFIQSVVRDISARKQAENALRESEEQNRLLFEESPDAVVLFNPNGRVVRINRAFGTITGRDDKQFIGHFVMELGILPRQLMEALSASVEESFEQDSKFAVLEFKLKHTSGELRDINARIFTVNLHGEPHYLASMHDITTSKRAEETLRLANAEMERALRLKDEFLANMSHELRTPLNAVLGITESLLEQISGPLNEKQQKYLQTVSESAQHLLELINDILDLAKINAGRIELDINKTDIGSAAHASLRMVRELAQKKGVDAALEIDKTIKLAWVDERRLKQMLVNLLSNAVNFTPKGGRVGLEVRGDAPAGILHFTVWDTGIGINPQDLRLLFQPFVQLDAGFARGNQGTGLGLALVSQMARLHGGSVSVESEPGKGSRFTISLPWVVVAGGTNMLVRREHPSTSQDTSAIRTKDGHPIILIVEDTEAVTMLISDYLTQHGYQVITARDGYEGIARSAETSPDLILMDVMMPELDGLETTRRIRNKPELATVPIIALTALAMAGDRESCIDAGMNDYLSKPVKLKELLDTIERHLAIRSGGTE